MLSSTEGWAVSDDAEILKWDGTAWSIVLSGQAAGLSSIYMLSSAEGWAVGSEIFRWDGSTWSSVTDPLAGQTWYHSVYMLSSTEGWIVGDGGAILRWDGSSWSTVTSPTGMSLFSVHMLSSNEGWAIGGDVIIRWNGSSWSIVPDPVDPSVTVLRSVYAVSSTDAWAVTAGAYGTIIRWNGTSWDNFQINLPNLYDVYMVSSTDGWIVGAGSPPTILRWDGSSWNTVTSPVSGVTFYSVHMLSSAEGWAVGFDGTIIRTAPPTLTNGGVAPISEAWDSTFTFEVTYSDADNDFPASGFPKLYLNGTALTMTEKDAADTNVKDGKVYEYDWTTTSADIGSHNFYFYAEDSEGVQARDPEMGTHSLEVTKKSTSLTCSVDDPSPAPGQEIGFRGYLRDEARVGLAGKTIYLYKNGLSTGLSVVTDGTGYYGIPATASSTPQTDNYDVRFVGDALYLHSQSPVVQVRVAAPAYKIFGWVKSERVPIANAQVTLDGQSTTTDENGYYEFTGLEGNRSYTIEVSAEGYESYSKTVPVGAADEQFDVSLVKEVGVGILPIAVAIAIVGCVVGGLLVFRRKRSRK
jgi:photosystem II stability/assembly factor-like uncharacterized protein